jgi:hypothetical protein
MEDVPASYLHYLWNDGMYKRIKNPVHQYILDTMAALESEVPDAIWKKVPETATIPDLLRGSGVNPDDISGGFIERRNPDAR